MINIDVEQKKELGELLAAGHRKFGKVAPRKPYHKDDDDGGGTGTADFVFEAHPLLAEQPLGAASDLTSIVTEHSHIVDEADRRSAEACARLQHQLALANRQRYAHVAKPSPY